MKGIRCHRICRRFQDAGTVSSQPQRKPNKKDVLITTLNWDLKVQIQHWSAIFTSSSYCHCPLKDRHSELLCHSHVTKRQYVNIQHHASITPYYLPIHICNPAANQWLAARQRKLTGSIALYICVETFTVSQFVYFHTHTCFFFQCVIEFTMPIMSSCKFKKKVRLSNSGLYST